MIHSHTVPFDKVKLDGFIKINHSPVSDVYIALSEISLECRSHEILGLKLCFMPRYVMFEACYRTRCSQNSSRPYQFTATGTLPEILHQLIKELPDETTLYLFGYQGEPVDLPDKCPQPMEVEGLHPKLIAVVVKS